LELSGLHYNLRCKLCSIQINFEIVPPTALKKFITGRGNSKKDIMLKEVFKKFGADYNDDNLCDAYCLAKYAMNPEM
jgi:crossover junction endodeoxyribonuclease RuvC